MYQMLRIENSVEETRGDIRNLELLKTEVHKAKPDIVIHMAAQPLVRFSYENPLQTYEVNTMGTANLLEAVRGVSSVRVVLCVTTDKVYENREWCWPYRENDSLGGYDPYSSSKACAELIVNAYRNSFYKRNQVSDVSIVTVRAGNVIGGGDFAKDRLIPDIVRGMLEKKEISLRNPHAIRPWQHVIEPLCGYLTLCRKLWENKRQYAYSFNFGPKDEDTNKTSDIANRLAKKMGGYRIIYEEEHHPSEATLLRLDCSLAREQLNWEPRLTLDEALDLTADWYRAYSLRGEMLDLTCEQIKSYLQKLAGDS
jgi:CDP-glucose 4,6-dehydratase